MGPYKVKGCDPPSFHRRLGLSICRVFANHEAVLDNAPLDPVRFLLRARLEEVCNSLFCIVRMSPEHLRELRSYSW